MFKFIRKKQQAYLNQQLLIEEIENFKLIEERRIRKQILLSEEHCEEIESTSDKKLFTTEELHYLYEGSIRTEEKANKNRQIANKNKHKNQENSSNNSVESIEKFLLYFDEQEDRAFKSNC
jgi:hypothetical protein